jgi:hypothetical protein
MYGFFFLVNAMESVFTTFMDFIYYLDFSTVRAEVKILYEVQILYVRSLNGLALVVISMYVNIRSIPERYRKFHLLTIFYRYTTNSPQEIHLNASNSQKTAATITPRPKNGIYVVWALAAER